MLLYGVDLLLLDCKVVAMQACEVWTTSSSRQSIYSIVSLLKATVSLLDRQPG